jgi:hypothetical protein
MTNFDPMRVKWQLFDVQKWRSESHMWQLFGLLHGEERKAFLQAQWIIIMSTKIEREKKDTM